VDNKSKRLLFSSFEENLYKMMSMARVYNRKVSKRVAKLLAKLAST